MKALVWFKRSIFAVVTIAASVAITPTAIAAADLADVWIVTPKAGEWQAFETAFKKHIEYRQQKKDPRKWRVYQPIVGDNLDYYVIRACCFEWADLDSYRNWGKEAKTSDHWGQNVDKYVSSVSHYLAQVDMENSNWPEDSSEFRYFEVINSYPKAGHGADISADKKTISDAAKTMKLEDSWSWGWMIGGKPRLSLAFAYKDYADMKDDEPSFMERLAKQMGSEEKAKELMTRWGQHFKGSNSTIYVLNEELSMK